MNSLAELPELNDTKPDRLPSCLLIIGFVLVSVFGSLGAINLLVAGRLPSFILILFLSGGIGTLFGWLRMNKGSSVTKRLFKTTRQRIQIGATAGCATVFLVFLVMQSKGLNSSWLVSFLVLSIVWSILLGIPSGGIGGLILASILKNKKSAIFGGIILSAIFSSWWMHSFMGSL